MAKEPGSPDNPLNFDELDPDSLTPEQRAVYDAALGKTKSMQSDYTRKTQELAEERRSLESQKAWADAMRSYAERGVTPEQIVDYVSKAENFFSNFDETAYQKASSGQTAEQKGDELFVSDDVKNYFAQNARQLVTGLAQYFQKQLDERTAELQETNAKMLNVYEDLGKVRGEYRQFEDYSDAAVMEKAREMGTTSLEAAADALYRDKVMEKTFEERLTEEREKWQKEQSNRQVETEYEFSAPRSRYRGFGEPEGDDPVKDILQEAVEQMGPGILSEIGDSSNIIKGKGRE